jgi:ribosome-binding factor A
VELSSDLRHAKLFISILADEDRQNEMMTILLDSIPKIRKHVGQRIQLRHTPEIELELDRSLERGARVSQLLDRIARGEV